MCQPKWTQLGHQFASQSPSLQASILPLLSCLLMEPAQISQQIASGLLLSPLSAHNGINLRTFYKSNSEINTCQWKCLPNLWANQWSHNEHPKLHCISSSLAGLLPAPLEFTQNKHEPNVVAKLPHERSHQSKKLLPGFVLELLRFGVWAHWTVAWSSKKLPFFSFLRRKLNDRRTSNTWELF